MKRQIVVISDVHIGTNYPTCWYQKSVHEPYLVKVLDWIIANRAQIKEFVILGDLFDFWTYPPNMAPPTIDMILQENPHLFGADGKVSQVLTALEGNVVYLCGNHDMNVTQDDLNKIPNPRYKVKKADDVYSIQQPDLRTTFTHGHLTTMFNAPDAFNTRFGGLPLGHFVTRAVAFMVQNSLKPGQTAANLPDQGSPYGTDISSFGKTLVNPIDPSISETFLNYIIERTQTPRTTPVVLANGQSIAIREAGTYYRNLWTQWVQKYGNLYAYKAIMADYDGSYMGWFAQKRAFESNTNMVVMGHTHAPKLGLPQGSLVSYVNSGFECVSKPDFGKQAFTFAVITDASGRAVVRGKDVDRSDMPTAQLFRVVNQGGSYAIEPSSAGSDWVTSPKSLGDFSCYVEIINTTGYELKRRAYDAKYGNYVVAPPETIPAGSAKRIWLQDLLGPAGTEGKVSYTVSGGPRRVDLTFACPSTKIAILNNLNSFSGSTAFRTKSGTGDWAPPNVIVTEDNPFYHSLSKKRSKKELTKTSLRFWLNTSGMVESSRNDRPPEAGEMVRHWSPFLAKCFCSALEIVTQFARRVKESSCADAKLPRASVFARSQFVAMIDSADWHKLSRCAGEILARTA